MTQTLESKPLETGEEVDTEVKKLTKEIINYDNFTTYAGFAGAAVGSILAIPFGPVAFVAGSAVGVASAAIVKIYADTKKKAIELEISNLEENKKITTKEAEDFKARLELIHTEKFQKSKSSSPLEETENQSLAK